MNKKIIFFAFLLLFLIGFFLFKYEINYPDLANYNSTNQQNILFAQQKQESASPEPFWEMTIPGLRQRQYKSKIANMQLRSSNNAYKSYLASYNSDELIINGQLTVPTGEQPDSGWPAIIFVHGYIPPTQYQTFSNYVAYVDYLARNDFVVFKIDLRGHANSDGQASGAYFSADYVIDILNARAALQNADFINENAIGLWGHSMAGNLVLRAMVAQPDIPAGVIWAGAVYTYQDMQDFGIDDNSYRPPSANSEISSLRNQLFTTHGMFDANNTFWQQVVPTNYLNDMLGVVQLHHAINDGVVSIEYSRNLANLLSQANVSHELYEYEVGGHNLSGNTFNLAMQRTVEFYKQLIP